MTQQNNTAVKEEWADADVDIGPTVFQPMDCYYRSHNENQDGDHIECQLQYREVKREYGIPIEDENAAENRELGYGIPDKTDLSSLHVECLESIWRVLLPRLQIFQCDTCHTVYADKSKFQQHTCSVKSTNKCKLCDKSFEKSNLLIKHVKHKHKLHMCEICGKTMKKHCIYLRHKKIVHLGKWENFHCISCNKICTGKHALRDHIRYSHSSTVYKCSECGRVFKMNVDLQRHITVEHRNERHECEYCFKVYKAQYLLRRHYKAHSDCKHECEVCKRSFTTKASLKLHFKVTHSVGSDLKIYECEKCFKIFKWPSHLSTHRKNAKCFDVNMQYEEKRLAETATGEQLKLVSSKKNNDNMVCKGFDMEKNKKDSGGQPKIYTCDYCKTTLGRKATLKRHILSTHATGSHKCEQCGKTYRCSDYLSNHIAHVHISEQHECKKCCKIFKSKSLLWSHMNSKHSTKKLQCTMCPRVFRLRPSLRYHMVSVHSQERHKCNKCKRVFKVRSLLLHHFQQIHTNKTYECDNCSKVFKLRSTLRIHLLNEICLKGKKLLKSKVIVKEDEELELGPVTFQHMDCNYRPYKEEPLSD